MESIRRKARKLGLTKDYAGGYRPPRPTSPNAWSKDEIKMLKNLYPQNPNKYLAKKLKRTEAALTTKAAELGLKKVVRFSGRNWKPREIDFLEKSYHKMTYRQIAEKMDRSTASVSAMAVKLELTGNRSSWTKNEDNIIRRHYGRLTAAQVAKKMDRSASAIKSRAMKLGISRLTLWTEKEVRLLKKHYLTHTYEEIAEIIGRPVESVRAKGRRLRLSQTLLK
ncbi:MAG: hypothetical protein KAR11_01845 [Phycisphaerae bacterium]|nr:hypothetical protein [Phycisphaerae bacterium]